MHVACLHVQAGIATGSYIVEVNVHNYQNPTGRCDECQPGPVPGCCDETVVRPAIEACPSSSACDTFMSYCDVPLGDPACEPEMNTDYYRSDRNSINFDTEGPLLGSDFPVMVERNEPWTVSSLKEH